MRDANGRKDEVGRYALSISRRDNTRSIRGRIPSSLEMASD